MPKRCIPVLLATAFLSGCLYHVREDADRLAHSAAQRPIDPAPPSQQETTNPTGKSESALAVKSTGADVRTSLALGNDGVRPAGAEMMAPPDQRADAAKRFELPDIIPGSESTLPLQIPTDPEERRKVIEKVYQNLPPLPPIPVPVPGPEGRPLTLADAQHIAAENSAQLKQAALAVKAAQGNYLQARAYPNPKVSYLQQPSSDGSTPGVVALGIDQVVSTGGKIKLSAAASEMDLRNAEVAFRRAQSDFNVLVAKETVRVLKALAEFTDETYRIQRDLAARSPQAAAYEPAQLKAQAVLTRLALGQAISTYAYDWQILAAAIGMRKLPLSEIAGRVDRAIPRYDYDVVLARVLRCHTDMLTSLNGIDKARYNLKLQQITPACPDVEFSVSIGKDFVVAPQSWTPSVQISVPLALWDKNKGNIIAAEAALDQAANDPRRVELALTNNVATAYLSYVTALQAVADYRRTILPEQVRAYRAIYQRYRGVEVGVLAFNDVVTAQQTLVSSVQTYLTTLGQVWTAVIGVADLLQTDDLFQLGPPLELPQLPNLECLVSRCDAPVAVGRKSQPNQIDSNNACPPAATEPIQMLPAGKPATAPNILPPVHPSELLPVPATTKRPTTQPSEPLLTPASRPRSPVPTLQPAAPPVLAPTTPSDSRDQFGPPPRPAAEQTEWLPARQPIGGTP